MCVWEFYPTIVKGRQFNTKFENSSSYFLLEFKKKFIVVTCNFYERLKFKF